MVRIGDIIKSNKGTGVIVSITKHIDGRYKIVFRDGNALKSLIEGDDEFKKI